MSGMIFRLGEKKYRVESDWAEGSSRQYINNVSAVSSDEEGYIYVLQRSDPFMLVFNGTFQSSD